MCRMWRNERPKRNCSEFCGQKTMNLYWIRPAEKTDGVLMSVFQVSVLQRRQKIKGWNVRLSRQFQKKYMNGWKRRWNNLKQDRVLSLIGLATKAGKCASGEFMTENETKSGKAALVIVAEDASDNTKKKKFRDMCKFMRFQFILRR